MKAYIRYGANGTIISGVLVKSNKKPTGVGWVEVPMTYCCSTLPVVGNQRNKAFIKYAGNMVIPGSTIIRKKKPKSGTWVEVPYQQCCTPSGLLTINIVTTDVDDEQLSLALLLVKSDNTLAGQITPATEGTYTLTIPSPFTGTLQLGGINDTGGEISIVVLKNAVEVTNEVKAVDSNYGYAYPITEGEVAQFNITITAVTP